MATVHFDRQAAGTGSALISVFMPRLHAVLLAAGWTLEYADSDAIGGGSSGSPAWDKTPTSNTDAGIAVYRMPTNGSFTRWYVRLRPGWTASMARPTMHGITVGDAHNGSGTVTGGGGELVPASQLVNVDTYEWACNASEDGFALVLKTTLTTASGAVFWLERLRLLDESVQNSVLLYARVGSTNTPNAVLITASGSPLPLAPLCLSVTGVPSPTGSLPAVTDSLQADGKVALGPFFIAGDPLTGLPRLLRIVNAAQFDVSSTVEVEVDGGLKTYRTFDTAFDSTVQLLMATE